MVRAELSHNPYLLETEVLFNGEPPRINSLVEKYQEKKLQEWISKVPYIFYNEMNGYDFELDFYGTELDYEELRNAFIQAGVGNDLVQLCHKGKLEGRTQKVVALDNLIDWLQTNPNRNFDFTEFFDTNKELFTGAYSLVTIGGNIQVSNIFDDIDIAVDNVNSVDELKSADLKSTVIIIYIDHKTVSSLHRTLSELLIRNDVSQNQLFFWVSPALREKIERFIRDLGVIEPQIVGSVSDEMIHRYMELYPVTEYIYDSIKVFRKKTDFLSNQLAIANMQGEIANNDIHYKIRELENVLSRLKKAHDSFVNRSILDMPAGIVNEKDKLITAINQWRIRKVKISRFDEAEELSRELQTEVVKYCADYFETVSQIHLYECEQLASQFDECYKSAKYQEDYKADLPFPVYVCERSVPVFIERLMTTKEEQYVVPKEDFFGKLFKAPQDASSPEPVLETTFYLEKWRKIAVDIITPMIDNITEEIYNSINSFYNQLAEMYSVHIEHLIEDTNKDKEEISAQLSEDEQLLQADNDWLSAFCDKLHQIERS